MQRAVVVCEAMFGNTKAIAEAVAEGLAPHLITDVVEVGTAPTTLPDDAGLLVVGGPTHAFGMSRSASREVRPARPRGDWCPRGIGLREWLQAFPRGDGGVAVRTFDTRIDHPRVPGSAARKAEKRLRHLRYPISASAESMPGPLVEGELERAKSWGDALGRSVGELESATDRRG